MMEFDESRIIHSDKTSDFQLDVTYEENHTFNIRVKQLSTSLIEVVSTPATYEPRFGIDNDDFYNICIVAESICKKFEKAVDSE